HDPVAMVKETEALSEREGVFGKSRGLERYNHLARDLIQSRGGIDEFPDIIRVPQQLRGFGCGDELIDAAEVEVRFALAKLVENVIPSDSSVLKIRSGFAVK